MRETTFKIVNTTPRVAIVTVMSKEECCIDIEYDNAVVKFDLNKGLNSIAIIKQSRADLKMDTEKSWVITTNNKHLVEIDGPIQHIEGDDLDSVFLGCYSLICVSEDVFERNSDKVKMTKTFMDCVEFILNGVNMNMFKYLPNVRILKETFVNNGNIFIPENVFVLKATHVVLDGTFKKNVYLEVVSPKAFSNLNCTELKYTFEDCEYLKSIHIDFFKNIHPLNLLIGVFKNSGINNVDENILTYIPSGVVYKDIFDGCDCKINKDFK